MLYKKLLATLLTLCMVLSLLPVTALADGEGVEGGQGTIKVEQGDTLDELKAGEFAENYGTIVTNNGTVTNNYGTVRNNNGKVTTNETNGKVTYNNQNGVIEDNNGSVYVNYGTVNDNGGTIELNRNIVETNRKIINTNYGIVSNSGGGNVATNDGEVYNRGGTIGSNTSTGTEYFRVIINNNDDTHIGVSVSGLKSAYNLQWLGVTGGVPATATVTLTPNAGYEIKQIEGLPNNVTAVKNADGTWTLTVTGGQFTTIIVPQATEKTYTVTVNNGKGSSSYPEGASVTIQANTPPAGQWFKEWEGVDGLTFTSGNYAAPTATFVMPNHDVSVWAVYLEVHTSHTVTVTGGTGGDKYYEGAEVTITANEPETGMRFKEWTGADELDFIEGSDMTSATATFYMPDRNVTVAATYEPLPTHTVTVTGGTGGGNYYEGAEVTITANAPETGMKFKEWAGTDGLVFLQGSRKTLKATFAMPAEAVTLTARYKMDSTKFFVRLTKEDGSEQLIELMCEPGDSIDNVKAKIQDREGFPPDQQQLSYYGTPLEEGHTLVYYGITNGDIMDLVLICDAHTVTVTGGTGGGKYYEGASVTITANEPGMRFKEWAGTDGLRFRQGSRTTSEAIFAMPDHDVTVTATYEPLPIHTVTVTGGTGGGNYYEGAEVTITANAPETGMKFKEWAGTDGLVFLQGSRKTLKATFAMPAEAVTLTARYKMDSTKFFVRLTKEDGSEQLIELMCEPGDSIDNVKAKIQDREGFPPDQQQLSYYGTPLEEGHTLVYYGITNGDIMDLVLICDAHTVTVTGGTGGGKYYEGASVTITANEPGMRFKEWAGTDGLRFRQGSRTTSEAAFVMPDHDVTVTATYEDDVITRIVSVNGGDPAEKTTVGANEKITLTVNTPTDITRLGLINENGRGVSKKASYADSNAVRVWTLEFSIATKGDRSIRLYQAAEGEELEDTGLDVKLLVSSGAAKPAVSTGITEISAPECAAANEVFTATVKTGRGVSKLGFYNEKGAAIGKRTEAYTDEGDIRIWSVDLVIGSKGDRTITVKTFDSSDKLTDNSAVFAIKIVRAGSVA